MDTRTTGALISLLLLLAILLSRPLKRGQEGDYNPVIQLFLLATGLLIAVGTS